MDSEPKPDTPADLIATLIKAKDLIAYQKNSIVSKTVINKPVGTVTFFAFDSGERLSEHTAPYNALVYILDGMAKITISGNEFTLSEGEMIIMPAHKPHAVEALKPFKMMLIMIKA